MLTSKRQSMRATTVVSAAAHSNTVVLPPGRKPKDSCCGLLCSNENLFSILEEPPSRRFVSIGYPKDPIERPIGFGRMIDGGAAPSLLDC